MPVLKIKKTDGTWQEVWGCISTGTGGGADAPKLTSITMLAANWSGTSNPWSQVVACNGVNVNSKLDLQPTPTQVVALQDAEISLMATNTNGVVTIYALGGKPTSDMTMDVLITEVELV
jgi:hypothetical protein